MPDFTILEPMSIGDIIDRSVRLYRRNFGPLLGVAAIPSLFGVLSSTLLFYGYSQLLVTASTGSGFAAGPLIMMAVGMVCYPVWGFMMLVAVSAMARVVSDHLMLGEEITFRKSLSAVRRRLGDITIMGLLLFGILFGFYLAVMIVVFVAVIAIAMMAGIVAALGLPGWLTGIMLAIGMIAGAAVTVVCVLAIISRFVFLPQVVMIEGESAGAALGRAIRLGAKNWYRVGAIVLFTYFVIGSLLTALMLPLLAIQGVGGLFTQGFMLQPGWGALYTGFDQLTRLLVLPIWMVSFTLLYFDSRVRKEGYDIEVLIRAFQPEARAKDFYWRPVAQPAPVPYRPADPMSGRPYVQTSPLGLGGYRPPRPVPPPPTEEAAIGGSFTGQTSALAQGTETSSLQQSTEASVLQRGGDTSTLQQSKETSTLQQSSGTSDLRQAPRFCQTCGATLELGARFCHRCGRVVSDE